MKHPGLGRRSVQLVVLALTLVACRRDPKAATQKPTGPGGETGTGFTAQCSGWFPDWISQNPPPDGTPSFQLSQGYPLGVPIFEFTPDFKIRIVRWDPFGPATDPAGAPWLAFDFHVPAERESYVNALKDYVLEGNVEVDFDVQKNTTRSWFHVPMMTSDPASRREPYHGLTKERQLRSGDHKWIFNGTGGSNNLDSFAIGAYNWLGGYTLGQVFHDTDPSAADPTKAAFIPGALVFKLLFAEHDPAKIDAALDPLVDAPEWQVLDVENPAAPLKNVRLLQVDVAVRDDRSTQTGWVFATFVYDKSMTAEANPWRRLRPVGLQWGHDKDVTGSGVGTVDESWLTSGVPEALLREDNKPFGRDGRLNGPVDNPVSSCESCHATAQMVAGATSRNAFRGARLVPGPGCTDAQDMNWFNNVMAGQPFGIMTNDGGGCDFASPATGTPPLFSLDYSLQLADALESSIFFGDPNPCAGAAVGMRAAEEAMAAESRPDPERRSADELRELMAPESIRDVPPAEVADYPVPILRAEGDSPQRLIVDPEAMGLLREVADDDEGHRR